MPPTPRENIHTGLDYIISTYGEAMTYWTNTNTHPAELPIVEREAWHRDAVEVEQDLLARLLDQSPEDTEAEVFEAACQNR